MVVTPNYFRVLGLRPILGREFVDAELGRPKTPPSAIILGYDLWQRKFNGDPNIVGRTIRMSRMPAPLPVVGVMPRGIRFLPDPGAAAEPNYDLNAYVDFWFGAAPDESRPANGAGNAIARLRDGATLADAQTEISAISAGLAQSDSALQGISAAVAPVEDVLNRDGRRLLVPLFGSVTLLFFIACFNVAGLLLTRGLQRHPEYAMRSALGAGRWRLFRQTLTESLVVAIAGAALGAALATGIITLLKAIAGQAVPRADAVHIGWPVFAFGFFAAVVAAGVAGLLPAARASLPDRFQSFKGTRTTASRHERRLLAAVSTLQIVLTVALLAGAALLIRTGSKPRSHAARLRHRKYPGDDSHDHGAAEVYRVPQAGARASVVGAGRNEGGFRVGLPLTGNMWPREVEFPGQSGSSKLADRVIVPVRSITQDYFDVMGMTIAEGRAFRDSDGPEAPGVAIVNATLAQRYYADRNPIGAHFQFAGGGDKPVEIVGVVADTRTEILSQRAEAEVYLPFWQSGAFSKHLVLRASGDPTALAALVRGQLRAIDPTAAVERVTTMAPGPEGAGGGRNAAPASEARNSPTT